MVDIIDLTVSPRPEIIEISSDQEYTPPGRSLPQEIKRKRKKGKTSNGFASDSGIGCSAQPSRDHSPETGNGGPNNLSIPHPKSGSQILLSASSSTVDEPGLFFFDGVAAPVTVEDTPGPLEPNEGGHKLLLPSHVAISHDSGPIFIEVIPPPTLDSDDEGYIEYLDYEDRKAPGLVRYFELEGEEINQARPLIFKCKNCGAEGDHKTYECPIQICLTCGARDEHSTRSCPISKTCYTCGMKGHIHKACPNRLSAHVSSDSHGDCDRCGSTNHKMNECPTLWRIYQYVNDEDRIEILQSRKEKKPLTFGEGGEGYIGRDVWCYNCANTGHLGDNCDELPHLTTFPAESSAFGINNVMSGPFYDPATEPVPIKRGPRDREGGIDWPGLPHEWDAGAPVDVGKRGKYKNKERLEKRFREQEGEADDWFNDIRNVKRRGMDQRAPPSGSRGKTLKFGLIKDGRHEPCSAPSSVNGSSLLARLGDTLGRNVRNERCDQPQDSLRIRGAATDRRNLDGPRKADQGRGQPARWDRDKPGGPRRGHGPRYKGSYDNRH